MSLLTSMVGLLFFISTTEPIQVIPGHPMLHWLLVIKVNIYINKDDGDIRIINYDSKE